MEARTQKTHNHTSCNDALAHWHETPLSNSPYTKAGNVIPYKKAAEYTCWRGEAWITAHPTIFNFANVEKYMWALI